MKKIEQLENIDPTKNTKALGLNATFYWAYRRSQDDGNDLLNFGEVIWDYDIADILKHCQEFEITEFTISSTFSSLIETIAAFADCGCVLEGLVRVLRPYQSWSNNKQTMPAFKLRYEPCK